jgi:hypothetical protein
MNVKQHLALWGLTVAATVAAGSAAIASAGTGVNVLSEAEVSAMLRETSPSPGPSKDPSALEPDEWAGMLPSLGLTARCVGTQMEITNLPRMDSVDVEHVERGPADVVSLNYRFKGQDIRVSFTGRCVNTFPTGSYTLGDEPEQRAPFGKWVEIPGVKAHRCPEGWTPATPVEHACETVPAMGLSPAPGAVR